MCIICWCVEKSLIWFNFVVHRVDSPFYFVRLSSAKIMLSQCLYVVELVLSSGLCTFADAILNYSQFDCLYIERKVEPIDINNTLEMEYITNLFSFIATAFYLAMLLFHFVRRTFYFISIFFFFDFFLNFSIRFLSFDWVFASKMRLTAISWFE